MKPFMILGMLIIGACSWFCSPGWAQGTDDPVIAEMISHVADSTMRQSISGLQSFGTRYSYASTRDTVARWIRQRFIAAGVTDVELDGFTLSGIVYNVVATIHGVSPSGAEIVIGAHYDSYSQSAMTSAPGADDDASGTSAVIELARVISALGYTPNLTLRFVAFSGEEQGLVGSSQYAHRAKNTGRHIRAMLNFDQIGYRTMGDLAVHLVWYEGGEELRDLATAVVRQYTTLNPLLSTEPRTRSDSYSFAQMEYPAVWWLEHYGTPFYHSTYDLVDYIDVSFAAEIARSALALALTLDKATVDVQPVPETIPAAVHLYQNYPNPFNPVTQINYTIAESRETGGGSSEVKLVVRDLLGREVAVLANERKAPGSYEVRFDASGLSSGVYFYELSAGQFVQTRTMILLK